jgi:cell division septation protein DedD
MSSTCEGVVRDRVVIPSVPLPEGSRVEIRVLEPAEAHLAVPTVDDAAMTIEQKIQAIAAQIPDEEWKRLPPDMIEQLDHYIYGTPKR